MDLLARPSKILLPLILLSLSSALFSQQLNTIIYGEVTDSTSFPLSLVNVTIRNESGGTFTNEQGKFELRITADNLEHYLIISIIGYVTRQVPFNAINDTVNFRIVLAEDVAQLDEVFIRDAGRLESPTMRQVPIRDIKLLPSASGSFENILVTLPGVTRQDELSSQYSVRGGNYDENLVYVNDIEIYRPQLIRSGKQEGLSFINPDLTGSVKFSAGGFNVSYGDKMSSALDITYMDPHQFSGSVSAGLLTSTAHIEGTGFKNRLSYISGIRYKTNRLLLRSLDTKANYIPDYYDMQSLFRFRAGTNISVSLLATYSINRYGFVPKSQRSSFGNLLEAYQIFVRYDGSETDRYRSYNIALTLEYSPSTEFSNKIILHKYETLESENFDIVGTYSLNALDKDLGSENLGDSIINIGTGSWLDHARNLLKANIVVASYRGRWQNTNNILRWGGKVSTEVIDDRLKEWKRIDSAGYTIPYSIERLMMTRSVASFNSLSAFRADAYLLEAYSLLFNESRLLVTGGMRISYWSFNDEILFSPRASLRWFTPMPGMELYIAAGKYYQSPFYREMRDQEGLLNESIKSQRSFHYLVGSSFNFSAGTTPFLLTCEMYFKKLDDLIPYKYDNVRIIYSATNNARGTVKGIDLRLHGEFVKNAESWISMSLMEARHDIIDDDKPSFPAPSDVRFSTDVFFQDYFPTNPSFRAHIYLHYSTGIPVSSPYEERYDNFYRMPPYRRVDIGFTKVLKDRYSIPGSKVLSGFETIVAGIEVFNLLDINNTVSYHWLSTVNNLDGEVRQFAVPNYLTGRSINVKLSCTFR
ncbi:MAG TPA: TonB-dependent receptor [Bacteroidales bacterium]|nr:TonB-dependent receptor [Bacteroidales bacterium]